MGYSPVGGVAGPAEPGPRTMGTGFPGTTMSGVRAGMGVSCVCLGLPSQVPRLRSGKQKGGSREQKGRSSHPRPAPTGAHKGRPYKGSTRWCCLHKQARCAVTRPVGSGNLAGMSDTATPNAKPDRVSLFVTCLVDQFYPEVGESVVNVLERLGVEVDVPSEQTCCGQPAYNSGYWDDARVVAARFLDVFRWRWADRRAVGFLRRNGQAPLCGAVQGRPGPTGTVT